MAWPSLSVLGQHKFRMIMACVDPKIKINGLWARGRRMGYNRLATLLIAPWLYVLWMSMAAAELKVCNQTLNLYNVAIGTVGEGGSFTTEGWWTLSANDCVSPIKDKLTSRYVYVFATSI